MHFSVFFSQSNRLRTKTVHKTRNPEFNETLTFYGMSDGDVRRKMLHILILGKLQRLHNTLIILEKKRFVSIMLCQVTQIVCFYFHYRRINLMFCW
jgi:hypothetical protein